MRLIGAGLPRTATLSQKVGIEMLGIGRCYHMVDLLADLSRADAWIDAFEGRADWPAIFAGYEATVDWPGSFFYRELIDAYPDAKVLLSVRDPEAWARSMHETVWAILYGDTLMHDLSLARYRVDKPWAAYTDFMRRLFTKAGLREVAAEPLETGALAQAMRDWNDEVRATTPPDRLLVWQATDGFEPLCEFLGVPVPEAEFPRLNESASFSDLMVGAHLEALNAWYATEEHFAH